jgi:hypothetical protein
VLASENALSALCRYSLSCDFLLQAWALYADIVGWLQHHGQVPPAMSQRHPEGMDLAELAAVLAWEGNREGGGGPCQCAGCRADAEAVVARRDVVAMRCARALALRSCANTRCTDLRGPSEAALRGRRCGGCGVVRYCSEACSRADSQAHRRACRLLQAQRREQSESMQ